MARSQRDKKEQGYHISSKGMLTFFHYSSLLKVLLSPNSTTVWAPSLCTMGFQGIFKIQVMAMNYCIVKHQETSLHAFIVSKSQHNCLYTGLLFGNLGSVLTVSLSSVFMVLDFCEDLSIRSLVSALLLLSQVKRHHSRCSTQTECNSRKLLNSDAAEAQNGMQKSETSVTSKARRILRNTCLCPLIVQSLLMIFLMSPIQNLISSSQQE